MSRRARKTDYHLLFCTKPLFYGQKVLLSKPVFFSIKKPLCKSMPRDKLFDVKCWTEWNKYLWSIYITYMSQPSVAGQVLHHFCCFSSPSCWALFVGPTPAWMDEPRRATKTLVIRWSAFWCVYILYLNFLVTIHLLLLASVKILEGNNLWHNTC